MTTFSDYLSPSQIGSLLTCGEQFRLTRVVKAPERPMWAGVGGSTVHRVTELLDSGEEETLSPQLWTQVWTDVLAETIARQPSFDPSEFYRSGRASKAWPEKEGPEWWAENGPRFVESWLRWRDGAGLEIFEVLDEKTGALIPAVEIEVWARRGDLKVRSIIDRVMTVDGEQAIVDLKTGSSTDAWPRQLVLNNLGLLHTYGVGARWGGFWSARKGGVETWHDLSIYDEDWVWDQVAKAKEIRDRELFVAQPTMLCKTACGVKQHCPAMGGTPFFPQDATLTHNKE